MLEQFWKRSEHAEKTYQGAPLTPEMIDSVERDLGFKLPDAYVELLKMQNGGIPEGGFCSSRFITLTGLLGADMQKPRSLLGSFGSRYWIEEWGYPPIGIYFGVTSSAGHEMLALDYRAHGPQGEPSVVLVDQEADFAIIPLSNSFQDFIRERVVQNAGPHAEEKAKVISVRTSSGFKEKFKKYLK